MEVKYYICIEQVNKTNKTESRINLCNEIETRILYRYRYDRRRTQAVI